jgi:hypothetical protein
MANRYTKWNPTEFVQTYDPYPFEEMFKMGQYKQGRVDQASLVAGKLAGEANIEGGYFTGDAAQQINKERAADINEITALAGTGNLQGVYRKYGELQNKWKNDRRVSSVESDRALMPHIATTMAKPEFGTTARYGAYDDTTGQFSMEGLQDKINAGHTFTPKDYNLLVNPGAEKAYGEMIDIIEPDLIAGFSKNEDGSYSSSVGDLDMATIRERSKGILDGLSSDGVTLDQLETLSPDAQSHIAFMKDAYRREGKQYKYEDAIKDFEDQAALRLRIKRSTKSTEEDVDDATTKGDDMANIIGAPLGPTSMLDASGATIVEIGKKGYKKAVEATGFDYFTLKDANGISALDYVSSDYTSDPNLNEAQNQQKRSEYVAQRREQDSKMYNDAFTQEYNKIQNVNKPKKIVVGGKEIVQQSMSAKQMEQEAHNTAMSKLYKRRLLGTVALNTALEVGEGSVPKFDKNGNVIGLSEEEKVAIQKAEVFIEAKNIKGLSKQELDSYAYSDLKIPKGFTLVGGKIVPKKYEEYFTKLDKNVKKEFGNKTFVAKQYDLYTKGGELGASEVPVNQKMIISAAQKLAKMPESNTFYNGKKINALNTKGSSTEGHSMDQLYLPQTAKGNDKMGDFTKGIVEFQPMTIYYNPNVNKWLTRGQYVRTGVKDETDLTSAIYEVDVTPTMSSILTGDENLQVVMQDAVHDALLSIPKGTSGVANIGITNEQLKEFGDIHVIHNSDDTYEVSGSIVINGKKVSLQDEIRKEKNLDPTVLDEVIAKDVVYNTWMNQNRHMESKNVDSEDHGLMQINDKTWETPKNRDFSSLGGKDWSTVDFDSIANDPSLNIQFSTDIVRHTPNGWKNWTTYNDAVKGTPNSNWIKAMREVTKPGGWYDLQKSNDVGEFVQTLQNSFGNSYTGKANEFDLTDAQLAYVIMMAESGGNPNAVGKNLKK